MEDEEKALGDSRPRSVESHPRTPESHLGNLESHSAMFRIPRPRSGFPPAHARTQTRIAETHSAPQNPTPTVEMPARAA